MGEYPGPRFLNRLRRAPAKMMIMSIRQYRPWSQLLESEHGEDVRLFLFCWGRSRGKRPDKNTKSQLEAIFPNRVGDISQQKSKRA